jgi:hypothetical protein
MTPAEFITLRHSLGLSEQDISMLTLVKEGQIKVWEQGLDPVPEGVAGLLSDLDREVEKRFAPAFAQAQQKQTVTLRRFNNPARFRREGPDMAPIPPMLAHKCHNALISRLFVALRRAGVDVTVVTA